MLRYNRSRFTQLVMTCLLGGILSLSAGLRPGLAWVGNPPIDTELVIGSPDCRLNPIYYNTNFANITLIDSTFATYAAVAGLNLNPGNVAPFGNISMSAFLNSARCPVSNVTNLTETIVGTNLGDATNITLSFTAILNDTATITGLTSGGDATGDGTTSFDFIFSLTGLATGVPTFTATVTANVPATSSADPKTTISNFMNNRANHILSNQPNISGFISGSNNGGGGPLGNLQLNAGTDTQTTMSFYTSRSKVMETQAAAQEKGNRLNQSSTDGTSDANSSFASAERFGFINEENSTDIEQVQANANNQVADEEQLAGQSYKGNDRTGTWDIWTQVHGAQSSQTTTKSKYWTANFGSHFFVNNDTLIGLLAQFDWASATDTAASSKVSGNGYMVGPYIAGKVKDQALYYEARALWGRSSNNISPIGTYTDSFDTERWLASVKVEGSYDLGDLKIKPGVSLSYFEETQNAYTDTNANLIAAQTISLGEFKFGPSATRSFDIGNGYTMRTNMGVSGIINFGVNNANTSTSNAFANEELRARVDAGFSLENEYGVRFTAAAYYDGIGTSGYESIGGNLGLSVPLN